MSSEKLREFLAKAQAYLLLPKIGKVIISDYAFLATVNLGKLLDFVPGPARVIDEESLYCFNLLQFRFALIARIIIGKLVQSSSQLVRPVA